VSVSSSASLKLLDKSTVCAPPATVSVTAESDPVGALFSGGVTVTEMDIVGEDKLPSLAVTLTVADPSAT